MYELKHAFLNQQYLLRLLKLSKVARLNFVFKNC